MKRYLTLSKYRNFGLKNEEMLTINFSLSKETIGDVVIIIGPNNSGKSNVLDALSEVSENVDARLQSRDVTTLSYEEADQKPIITFGVVDDGASLTCEVSSCGTKFNASIKKDESENFEYENCLKEFESWLSLFANYFPNDSLGQQHLNQLTDLMEKTEENFLFVVNDYLNLLRNRNYSNYNNVINQIKARGGVLQQLVFFEPNDPLFEANAYMEKKYGIPFMPKIIRYEEKKLDQRDLETNTSDLENSLFFCSVFKAIGIDPKVIKNAYRQYAQFRNKAILNKIKKEIDKKIELLSDEFNRMYFAEKDQYHFAIELDEATISFSMSRGEDEEPIMIEYQSTGFRWFFDLFFNFLSSNRLHPGDIIIMDEPATHLHPQGQRELRCFLKKFALFNGLTFVIATHSPFLIDTKDFDELRIVSMENNQSHIFNMFNAVNIDDPDSLKPIKESLTIQQNVFYDLNTEVVFVEGITDYNYLNLFKDLLDYENIAFLPFQGVGDNDEKQEKILRDLIYIRFYKKELLLDGDMAGLAMKERCKGTDFENALCISEVFDGKKEIEDLFSEEDCKKFPSLDFNSDQYKKEATSSIMKKICKKEDFSNETLDNFKKLFDRLVD